MIKTHINDTDLFKLLSSELNGYQALIIACKIFRELN